MSDTDLDINGLFEGRDEADTKELTRKIAQAVRETAAAHDREKQSAGQAELKARFLAELNAARAKGYRGSDLSGIRAKYERLGLDFGKITFNL